MKVTNWHKRNRGAAADMEGTAAVSGSPVGRYVQMHIRTGERGILSLTMDPAEADTLAMQLLRSLARSRGHDFDESAARQAIDELAWV